jgi:hypothetical protein
VPTDLPPPRREASTSRPDAQATFERRVLIGFVLVVFGLLTAEVVRDFTPIKLSVLVFVLAWLPLVAVHELGHALAAWMCGWRVGGIAIGQGRPLASFRVRGVPVRVGRLPLGGFVAIAPRHLRQVRLRSAFIYLMGPGLPLLFLGALVLALGPARLTTPTSHLGLVAAQAIAVAILVGAAANLVPRYARRGDPILGPMGPSDGMGIIMSFVWPRATFERMQRQGAEPPRD